MPHLQGGEMIQGTYSSQGFRVVAGNALELVTGTQAASAGYVAENIRATGQVLHGDLTRISGDILSSNESLREVNQKGFDAVRSSIESGNATAGALGAINLAVQAAGFIAVSSQLSKVNGEIGQLRREVGAQAAEMARLQGLANAKLESLIQVAERTLQTQERILEALVQSRAGEAQQLIRQGWENLRHGYRDDAASRFERSLEYDNTVYISHAMLADICRERKEPAKAEAHYQRAVAFSSDKGPDIKAHAHMQYARFLEEAQRYQDAAKQVEQALGIQDRPAWRFFLAELQIAAGELEAGLATLRGAIGVDANLFPAVLMSSRLSQHQGIAAFLVEVDTAVRGPLLEELPRLKKFLCDLSDASARLHAPAEPPSLEDLLAQERDLLQAVAARPFQELKELEAALRKHGQALEAKAARIGDSLLPPILEIASRFGALSRMVPSMKDQAEAMGAIAAPPISSDHVHAFIISGVLAFVGLIALSTPDKGLAVAMLIVSAAVAWLGTDLRERAAARRRAATGAEGDQASRVLQAWQDFLHEQAVVGRQFVEAKDSALSRLAAAKGDAVWPSARAHLKALVEPLALTPPAWVAARSSRCTACGAVCRSGSPECPRCGGRSIKPASQPGVSEETKDNGQGKGAGRGSITRKIGPWALAAAILAGSMAALAYRNRPPPSQGFVYSGATCNCVVDFPCEPQVEAQPGGALLVQCQDSKGRTFKLWSENPGTSTLDAGIQIPATGMDSARYAELAAVHHYRSALATAGAREERLTSASSGDAPSTFLWATGTARVEGKFFYGTRGYQYLSVQYGTEDRPSVVWFFDSFRRLADEPGTKVILPAEPVATALPPGPEKSDVASPSPGTEQAKPAETATPGPGARCVPSVEAIRSQFESSAKEDLGAASQGLLEVIGGSAGAAVPILKSDRLLRAELFKRPGTTPNAEDLVLQIVSQAASDLEGAEYQGVILGQFKRAGDQYCVHNVLQERRLHCWSDPVQAVTFDWIEGGIAVERAEVDACQGRSEIPVSRMAYLLTGGGVRQEAAERKSRRVAQ